MKTNLLLLLIVAFICDALVAQTFTEVSSSIFSNPITYGDGNHGGGVSFADFNNDGNDDLTFTSASGLPVYFYENNGNGTWTQRNFITNTGESKEAIWADYDNDGDQDLFLTVHDGPNRLYQNNGAMVFTDVTMAAFGYLDNLATFGAAWGDYDRDGWLDLYVCEYIFSGTESNKIFRNNGNGTFEDVSAGNLANNGPRLTFDAVFADYNGDLWPDLYVINDKTHTSNTLYENQFGTLTPALQSGANINIEAMNAGGADFDDDGDYDFYVTNTQGGNVLLLNNNNGTFNNVAGPTGTAVNQICWGATFFDYDNDLDQDLYVSSLDLIFGWHNPFLVNEGDGTFSNPLAATNGLGGGDIGESYGQAVGDLNNDGKLDIAVCQEIDPNWVWQNNSPTGNYVRFRLSGVQSNRDGIGALVEIDVNGSTYERLRHGSMGYLSQHSQSLHFGLGTANAIDQIRVYWPSGIIDVYNNFTDINQLYYLTEGDGALPIDLVDFSASRRAEQALLSWTTAIETGSDFFEVQRSLDGRDFTPIGTVAAANNSTQRQDYQFLDPEAGVDKLYYRLRMVDLDGTEELSPIRTLAGRQQTARFSAALLSNPVVGEELSLQLATSQSTNIVARIFDSSGRQLQQWEWAMEAGELRQSLPINSFPAGQYYLQLSDGTDTIELKLIR